MSRRRRVLVVQPVEAGAGFWSRRVFQHLQHVSPPKWDVDLRLHRPGAGVGTLAGRGDRWACEGGPDVVLAIGWRAAAAIPMPDVPLLLDVGEVTFPVAARRTLSGFEAAMRLDGAFGDLIEAELATCASATGLIAATRFDADLLDDLLGRRDWTSVVAPAVMGAFPPDALRRGLVFVRQGHAHHKTDRAALGWLQERVVPLLPAPLAATHPLVTDSSIWRLTSARVALIPPLLGGGGFELAVHALGAGAQVVAPARIRDALPPDAHAAVHVGDDPRTFAAAVTRAVDASARPFPESAASAVHTTHGHDRVRAALLAALERVLSGSAP